MYLLTVKVEFDAAHRLEGYKGDCANLHGHRWTVEASFDFSETDNIGICCDFKILKDTIKGIVPDHKYLNDIMPDNPTAENISKWIFDQLKELDFPVVSVVVWETPSASVTYYEDEEYFYGNPNNAAD